MADGEQGHLIRAAGGVVWRVTSEGSIEIALVHRPRYDDWSIPKGKLAPGETEVEGAIREVYEETGFRVHLGRYLGEARYMKETRGLMRPKVVRYWAMQADGGGFEATREVDELRWVSLAEAPALLTHDHDRELLERFARGPAVAGIVLLVRHASAGDRSDWNRDDRLRPLDTKGWEQSEELVRLLSRFDVSEIVSADYRRCTQTVQPFGEAVGLDIKQEPLFSEAGFPAHEDGALKTLRTYAAPGRAAVVCSQGDVIPGLLARLAADDGIELPDPIPCKKASVWALTFDGERLFSAEYFPPPSIS